MIHIALAADARFFPGLEVSVYSFLLYARPDLELTIHVMDGGIADEDWDTLCARVGRLNPKARTKRHPILKIVEERIGRNLRGFPLAYARLLLGSTLGDQEKVVYFDSDLLFLRDIEGLWSEPMDGSTILAVPDQVVQRLANDNFWLSSEEAGDKLYFNSGLLVIDLCRWRSLEIEASLLDLIRKNPEQCTFWDQTPLNHLLRDHVRFLGEAWNRQIVLSADEVDKPVVLHCIRPQKPWFHYEAHRDVEHVGWRWFYRKVVNPRPAWQKAPAYRRAMLRGRLKYFLQETRPVAAAYSAVLKGLAKKNPRFQIAASDWNRATSREQRAEFAGKRRLLKKWQRAWGEKLAARNLRALALA